MFSSQKETFVLLCNHIYNYLETNLCLTDLIQDTVLIYSYFLIFNFFLFIYFSISSVSWSVSSRKLFKVKM